MVRVNNSSAKAMEFTSFKKSSDVTLETLLNAALNFETVLAKQEGVTFHCLVRNLAGDKFANILFASDIEVLKFIEANLMTLPEAKTYFNLIDMSSVKMEYHTILKDNFKIPEGFSCVEKGTFSLKTKTSLEDISSISHTLEEEYLKQFPNTKEHFIGTLAENQFSEITLGLTLGMTRNICMGYFDNPYGKSLLAIANEHTVNLDFWHLIA
jgi:hypothetical protein